MGVALKQPRNAVSDHARKLAQPSLFGCYERLTDPRKRFVDEYLVDLNAWQASIRAGLSGSSAYTLLRNQEVLGAIRERRALIDSERSVKGAAHVLNKLWDIETADPRDLVEIWKVPCRFCWGVNGQYQFTRTEAHRRMQAHELGLAGKPLEALFPCGRAEAAAWHAGSAELALDPQGGDGYTSNRDPNPTCTECGGDGVTIQHVTDTRKLTAGGRALYRGVKVTKEGHFEVLMADQALARDMLARHYGVAIERKRLLVRKLNPDDLTDEELVQSLAELEEKLGDEANDTNVTEADYEVIDDEPGPNKDTTKPVAKKKYFQPVPGKRKQHREWQRKPQGVPYVRDRITRPTR
jgi:hypothetical protein